MKKVNRQALVEQLEAVAAGLSTREIVEQTSCYVFKDGFVTTYNDEIACSQKCDIGVEGAVQAAPLLALLSKLSEEDVDMGIEESELRVKGAGRRCGIRVEADIRLPIGNVDRPKEWKALHEDFLTGVELVSHSAGTDQSKFVLTCVHIHPKFVETCDSYQITRVPMKTGISKPTLIRRDSLRHIVALGMKEISETESWVHFRNTKGLIFSCRRWTEDYPDLTAYLECSGATITLPKGLGDAAEKASVFTETATDNTVLIELRPGKLRLKGVGPMGWYSEVKQVNYEGKDLAFMIAPNLLTEITKRHNDAVVSQDRLKVDGGKFIYVTRLGLVGAEAKDE